MNSIQKRLEDARTELLNAQSDLALFRKNTWPIDSIRRAEALVCRAIDRAWDAQCMAQGSL